MWPDLFGPGWVRDVLLSAGLLAGVIAVVAMVERSHKRLEAKSDPLQEIWRRYEQGDLTQWEFERLRRQRSSAGSPQAPTASGGRFARKERIEPTSRPALGSERQMAARGH